MFASGRFWRASCVVGVATVGVVFAFGGIPAVGAPGGSISGRVTDNSGNPLSGICVNVENGPGDQTNAAGMYAIAGLGAGSYKVGLLGLHRDASVPRPVVPWPCPTQGRPTRLPVTDGAVTPLADVELALGVAVSGTVTDTLGTPIAGISVNVNPVNQGVPTGTQTDADGQLHDGSLAAW